jgi:tetratricopeptide (TPR) repeat protein
MNRKSLSLTLLIVVLSSASLSAQSKDRVFLSKGGAAPAGKITERTKDKVTIEMASGKVQTLPTNDIQRIVFEGEPQSLSRAKDSVVQGQYDQAIRELADVSPAALSSEDMKEDYYFYKLYVDGASALMGQGNPDAASKALVKWAGTYRNSHNFYKASEMLGDLAIAAGTPDQATKFYGVLAASGFADLKLKGAYLQGRSMMLAGKFKDAIEKLSPISQEKIADPAGLKIQKLSSLTSIRCEASLGNPEEAINKLERIVDEGDSTDAVLFAELYNALGAIFASQGNDYEAVLSYLKTDLLYSSQSDPHAEALYHLSKLWEKVGEPLKATEAKSRLAKQYPTSPWVKK